MQRYRFALVLVAGVLFTASCGGTGAGASLTDPSAIVAGSQVSFTAASATSVARRVNNAACPTVPPFVAPVDVIVRVDGSVVVFVTDVTLQFTDTFGAQMPSVTLPGPVPTVQFGTALDQARSPQTLPLTVGIGCATARTGTAAISIGARDQNGHRVTGRVTVAVL